MRVLSRCRHLPVAALVAATAAIAWSGPAAAAPPANSVPATYHYVALGDSYTASTGFNAPPDSRFVPVGCAQSQTNYPHQVAALLRRSHRLGSFADASCGGATIPDFTHPQHTNPGTNAPQFDRITSATNLVTIGIGGNDAGLIPLARQCVQDGIAHTSCKAAHVRNGIDDTNAGFEAVVPKIVAAIRTVRARAADNVQILLVNYLEAVPDNGRGCYPTVPVLPVDGAWFTQKYKQLNAILAAVARSQHVRLVDTYAATIGHNVCTAPTTRYVEFLGGLSSDPPFSLAAPLHPNIGGANAQTRAVAAAIP